MADIYAAFDLGGTKVRAVIADLGGRIHGEDIRPSGAREGLGPVLANMVGSVEAALEEAGADLSALKGAGVASPGPVDVHRGVVPGAPQLKGWRDVPLVELMQERLKVPVALENDANAAAVGENRFGAGRGARHMIYVTVSTGVGGGIIIDGDLYRGVNGSAGELGHVVIDLDGPPCGCGNRGCLEAFSSGTAIARRGEEAAASGESEALAAIAREGRRVTPVDVAAAAAEGDETARAIFDEAGFYLGVALAGHVNTFNPEAIIVGGGVTASADLFFPRARETMEKFAMSEPLKHARLALAELGDYGGVLGMIARLGGGEMGNGK